MTAHEELLAECARLNVRLRAAAGGQLAIGGPRKALTTNLLKRIKVHKADLLLALAAASEAPGARPTLEPAAGRQGVSTRRLCGNGFPAIPIKIPPPEILTTALVLCRQCNQRPVLRELRELTGGRCYECAIGEGVGHV